VAARGAREAGDDRGAIGAELGDGSEAVLVDQALRQGSADPVIPASCAVSRAANPLATAAKPLATARHPLATAARSLAANRKATSRAANPLAPPQNATLRSP
jgi:hypothetical protein